MKRNRKFNKILSSALVLLMIFTSALVLFPAKADAAYVESDSNKPNLNANQIKEIVKEAYSYTFDSAEEMLVYELEKKYLDSVSSKDGNYTMYVNRYTGVMYYVNNITGQILTSNPYYYSAGNDELVNRLLLSQISVEFSQISTGDTFDYNSTQWAALYTQISTNYIDGGIRVKYTLGDTTARFLLPGRMTAEKFEAMFTVPMLTLLAEKMEEYCGEHASEDMIFNVFEDPNYSQYTEYTEYTNNDERQEDRKAKNNNIYYRGTINNVAMTNYVNAMRDYATELNKKDIITDAQLSEITGIHSDITRLHGGFGYNVQNVASSSNPEETIQKYYTKKDGGADLEIYETLAPIYALADGVTVSNKRTISNLIREYNSEYTFSQMFADEKECGYVSVTDQKPVIRCALEYTFNDDGSLSVRLPANSISFDSTVYNLGKITPLEFFGVGDLLEDGYIFFPDGSGTIIEFNDFYNSYDKINVYNYSQTYGKDYCYSNITGAHREQITMPVYGVVADTNANPTTEARYGVDKVTNGYFAIIEEGASLATIAYQTGGSSYRYGGAFCWYTPYPSDEYDLSETVSVGSAVSYTIVSKSEYTGSYVTRIAMLSDDVVGEKAYGKDNYYASSYVGMATYYRDRLITEGVLTPMEQVSEDLPLYIEALGSMEIIEKVLSFPVTKKVALTEFSHIETMYRELSDSVSRFTAEAEKYEAMAAGESDEILKKNYEDSAAAYRDLVSRVQKINNINFRLTGFGNGGLYNTYPTKVRWDRACGGKKAFESLMNVSKEISSQPGVNFGVYPDYDFMYINHTEIFDGITIKGNVSRMVDNRYASKQVYDSVLQEYVSYYTLVINPESLDKLYSKFLKKISKYDVKTISVATMGSDLNSNFDEDQPVNRDQALNYVTDILDKMVNRDGFDIMIDVGNIYSVKYASHILDASIDSSHLAYSSYTVPFVGMVIHSYVNYAGSPLNYSGTPAYDRLRCIESGAALYYILCYQNSGYMKEDENLNDYYGVDYATWYDDIVTNYKILNDAIGSLQTYKIVDHRIILGERVIEDKEVEANYEILKAEIVEMLAAQLENAVTEGYKHLDSTEADFGRNLAVVITKADRDALIAQFADVLQLEISEIEGTAFAASVDAVIAKYNSEYSVKDAENDYIVTLNRIEYNSKHSFITDSEATAGKDYVYTDFTSDIGNIALVTYSNGTDTVKFILNYNMYDITVILDGVTYEIAEHDFVKITAEGGNEQ